MILVERLHASILQDLGQLRYHSRAQDCVTPERTIHRHVQNVQNVQNVQTCLFSGVRRGGCRGAGDLGLVQPRSGQRTRRRDPVADLQPREGADRQPGEADLQVQGARRTRPSTATIGSSSTCSIRAASSCGPTTTCRPRSPRRGSRVRRSSTRGPCSCRTIPTSARRSSGSGSTTTATSKRLTLNAPEVSRKEYLVAKFQLLPQSENIFLIYKDGWHPAEVAPDNATVRVAVDEEDRDAFVPEPQEGRDLLPGVRRPDRPVQPAPAGDRPRSAISR